MSTFSTGPGWEPEYVLQAFDWSSMAGSTVVDVGGCTGTTMTALSEEYPQLQCIVQDLPSTIAKRPALPQQLESRISFMAHDFFTEQPIKGADVYFFRMVLHDWSDGDAVRILKGLVPALKPGAHVLLNEWCLPEPNTASWLEEKKLR
jgi:trans-aconitate methyltransferase